MPHDGLGPGGALGGGQAPHLVGGHDIVIGGNVVQLDRILGGIRFAQVLSQRQAVVLGGEVLVHAQHHNAVVAHDCTADLPRARSYSWPLQSTSSYWFSSRSVAGVP